MAAVSLLEENPEPTERDVRLGLEGNLCRCTGYHNIVKAVLAAAETARAAMTVVGTRQCSAREDPALLTGEARFVDDLAVTGALHVKIVRSPFAHATIRSIDTDAAPGDARCRRGAHGRRPRRRLADAAALRVAGHRRHEEPGALPARGRRGVLRRRRCRGRRRRDVRRRA